MEPGAAATELDTWQQSAGNASLDPTPSVDKYFDTRHTTGRL